MARVFAEFQAAGRGKIGHIIGVRNLAPGNGEPFRHDAVGETNQDHEGHLTRIIHDGSSRNGEVARDKREERDLRDV